MVQIHPDPPTSRRGCGIGAIAQLGERLLCKQEVTGSIPVGSTSPCGRQVLADGRFKSEGKAERRRVLRCALASSGSQNRLIFNNSGKEGSSCGVARLLYGGCRPQGHWVKLYCIVHSVLKRAGCAQALNREALWRSGLATGGRVIGSSE
jgi:hypothetical protein